MKEIDIQTLFQSFQQLNVLIIGDVMIDSYLWGNVERISPEAPVPIVTCNKRENRLGGAANVALNIKALGANPVLCSVIGNDDKSPLFFQLLKDEQLVDDGILSSEHRTTTSKTRVISGNHHMLRVDQEVEYPLYNKLEDDFLETIQEQFRQKTVHAVIFEDYDKGVITQKIIDGTVEIAKGNNIPVLVDPKKRNFHLYKNVTLFKPNFKEFAEGLALSISKDDVEMLHQASNDFQGKMGVKYVMITLSEKGVFINHQDKEYHALPAEIRDIADVSGAGDTVISVAALCLAQKTDAKDVAIISNLAGGLVCEKVGVVPIDKHVLLKETLAFFHDK